MMVPALTSGPPRCCGGNGWRGIALRVAPSVVVRREFDVYKHTVNALCSHCPWWPCMHAHAARAMAQWPPARPQGSASTPLPLTLVRWPPARGLRRRSEKPRIATQSSRTQSGCRCWHGQSSQRTALPLNNGGTSPPPSTPSAHWVMAIS